MKIEDFCNPEDTREYLRAPFQINSSTFASNGDVAVVVNKTGLYPELVNDSLNHTVENHITKINQERVFMPLPELVFPDLSECVACKGIGLISTRECPECDGDGDLIFENGYNDYEVECKSCDGAGKITKPGNGDTCEACNGVGQRYGKNAHVMVFGVAIAPQYLNLIVNTPGIEVSANPIENKLYFKSEDARGLICGLRL